MQLGYFLVETFDNPGGVLAVKLEYHAGDDFFCAVTGHHAAPDGVAELNLGDILYSDGSAVNGFDSDAFYILDILKQSDAAYKIFFLGGDNVLAADIVIVFKYRGYDIVDGQVVLEELVGIDVYLILEDMPADRKDVGDSGHGLQLIFHDPVVDIAQVDHGLQAARIGVLVQLQVVDEDLPQSGGNWSQGGFFR